jgi:drug/metabolite transporter (DMT)-like permease
VTSGSLYIVGSAFAFSVMTLLVKMAGERLPSQEIVLARAVVSLVLSYALLRRAAVSPWGRAPRLLVMRGLVGFLALSCVYYAVTHLPLAEATVIQYLNPAFTAVLAAAVLGERLGPALVTASGVSLLGVALVARPAFLFGGASPGLDPFAVAVAVCGALFSAGAYVLVRRLSATEHPLVIVFYFPLVTVPATIPALWSQPVWPVGREWLVLLGVGCATQAGQVWVTRGLALEPASRATALSYLQILFATLWGAAFFGELPDPLSILGAGLIVGGTLAVGLNASAGG